MPPRAPSTGLSDQRSNTKIQSIVRTITKRARRYDLVLPLQFRGNGAAEWSTGELVNISRSGLLFHTSSSPPFGLEFEARFNIRNLDNQVAAEIRCSCAVARHDATGAPHAVAGRILRSEMNGAVDYPWGRTVLPSR